MPSNTSEAPFAFNRVYYPNGTGIPNFDVDAAVWRIGLANNNTQIYAGTYHNINRTAGGTADLVITARITIKKNGLLIGSNQIDNPNVDNLYISTVNNLAATTINTGDVFEVYAYTLGRGYGTGGSADGTSEVSTFITVTVPKTSGFFLRTSANRVTYLLPDSVTTSLSLSPLFIFKNANFTNSCNFICPALNDSIDDINMQLWQISDSSPNSGGAIVLFPNATLGSWYVASDYTGNITTQASGTYSNQWFTNNPLNVATAVQQTMNIYDNDLYFARRANLNWITLPSSSTPGRLVPIAYVGSNTYNYALAFRNAIIDNIPVYNSVTSQTFAQILGGDGNDWRTPGIVLISGAASNQYYIIAMKNQAGGWWSQQTYIRIGSAFPSLTGPNYVTPTTNRLGFTVLNCNSAPNNFKVYSPAYNSGFTTSNASIFSILKVRQTNPTNGGNLLIWIGNGQEYGTGINGGTSNVFWGNQQFMVNIFANNAYQCMWYGCKPESNYFKHFFIGEYQK
jgi:hypothetical protein